MDTPTTKLPAVDDYIHLLNDSNLIKDKSDVLQQAIICLSGAELAKMIEKTNNADNFEFREMLDRCDGRGADSYEPTRENGLITEEKLVDLCAALVKTRHKKEVFNLIQRIVISKTTNLGLLETKKIKIIISDTTTENAHKLFTELLEIGRHTSSVRHNLQINLGEICEEREKRAWEHGYDIRVPKNERNDTTPNNIRFLEEILFMPVTDLARLTGLMDRTKSSLFDLATRLKTFDDLSIVQGALRTAKGSSQEKSYLDAIKRQLGLDNTLQPSPR